MAMSDSQTPGRQTVRQSDSQTVRQLDSHHAPPGSLHWPGLSLQPPVQVCQLCLNPVLTKQSYICKKKNEVQCGKLFPRESLEDAHTVLGSRVVQNAQFLH